MAIFSHEQLLELKSKVNKREFFRQFLQLQQKGRLLWAVCPFHNDSSPSLSIDEETGIWKCWTENISGDIIDFYQRITGKSFVDSVIDIAKSQNIKMEISEELKQELQLKQAIYTVNDNIANLYQQALVQNKEGQEYLISRNFTMDIIKKFKIGYIPSLNLGQLGQQFIPFLREAGLLNVDEVGNTYNYFSTHRISIPFFDEYGHIVGFSSRVTNNNIKPKYLHSRTNKVFKKDELLYAYNFAKESIKESKTVIFTEGQIDCIRAHQYGINNCVALCGLALSEKQIKLLKTYVKNYYLIVEDKAGEDSLDRLYDTIITSSFWSNVKIIRLYEGDNKCDLDEFLQKYGKGEFLSRLKHAPTYHEYKLIDSLKNINYKTIEEKKFHIYNNRKYIAKITNPIDKKQYIELLASKLELPENDVRKVIARAEMSEENIIVGNYDDRRTTAQKYIIATFFSHFGIAKSYEIMNNKMKIYNRLDNKFRKIYDKIVNIILLYGAKADIMNIVHSTEMMSIEEINILDDAYFKNDDFDYLSDEEELTDFLKDQISNLR